MDDRIYEYFCEAYEDNWYLASRAQVLSTFIRSAYPALESMCVADIGAGTGKILSDVRRDGSAIAVERSLELASFGRGRYELPYVVADFDRGIPLAPASVDLALLLDVLEHVDDEGLLLGEIARTLRPGGALIISVPAFQHLWSRHDELHHHRRRYSRRALMRVLQANRFRCVRMTYYNTWLFPLVYVSRMLERVPGFRRSTVTDYDKPPRAVAEVLRTVFRSEAKVIPRFNLPVGVSLIAVAKLGETPIAQTAGSS
jgi:SAM-dependent methyltransferase